MLGTIEEARDEVPAQAQIMALALLTRVAADTVAVEGGTVSNLHEYQDSWGFLRVVETEADELSRSNNEDAARAAQAAKDYLAITDAAFGDLQGSGEFEMDPSLLYGAAAHGTGGPGPEIAMFIVIGDVLDRHEVTALREAASRIPFEDGKATAGRYAWGVKHNLQARFSKELEAILEKVRGKLDGQRGVPLRRPPPQICAPALVALHAGHGIWAACR